MAPTHATKAGIRYRYYVSLPCLHGEARTAKVGSVSRLVGAPARLIDGGSASLVGIVQRIDAGAPAFVRKRRIGDDIVERLEGVAVLEPGIGQRVPLHDERRGVVCRIMFMRARPLVAASFSCPLSVTGVPASSPTFRSSEPEPQVGS